MMFFLWGRASALPPGFRPALFLLTLTLPVFAANLKLERDGAFWNIELTGTLPAQPVSRITAAGDLTVRGKSASEIRYTLTERLRVPDVATARRIAESYAVHSVNGQLFFPQRAAARVELPRSTRQLALWSAGGNIDAAGLDGSVRADTAAGKVTLDRIAGDVEIHSSGGATTLGSIGGLVHCYSGGGPIRAVFIRGQAVFETSGGDIQLGEVMGPVRATTAAGGINIEQAGAEVVANTYGGAISILSALGMVMAQSAGGPIRLNNVSGRLRASTESGSIVAEVLRGHPLYDSFLATGAGDITVFLPSDTGVTVQAETNGPFESDFPGVRRAGASFQGKINGGGALLKIVGTGGRVEIRKE